MKKFTLLLTALTLSISSFAQFAYNVAYRSETYAPLTGATSINGSTVWDEESYQVPMPFSFKLGSTTINKFSLMLGLPGATTDTSSILNGFMIGDIDIADRGSISGTSLSPIRYLTTGTAPNRIFKVELSNAGFYNEADNYNTMNDFINVQIWYYETSNVVELHYGQSQITYPGDYYNFGNGPLVGYVKNLNFNTGTFDAVYGLNGNVQNPTIDSVNIIAQTAPTLATFPTNGTVYKFTPKNNGGNAVNNIPGFTNVKVYPTVTSTSLNIAFNEAAAASYEVIGMDGRTVGLSGKLVNGSNSVDVSGLAAGVYVLRIENSTNRSIYRFSKK